MGSKIVQRQEIVDEVWKASKHKRLNDIRGLGTVIQRRWNWLWKENKLEVFLPADDFKNILSWDGSTVLYCTTLVLQCNC